LVHGFNSRLDTLQAALLLVKIRYIDEYVKKRGMVAKLYKQLLADVPQIMNLSDNPKGTHANNYFTFIFSGNRAALQAYLKEQGIASAVYYPQSLHIQEVYKPYGYKKGDLPVSENIQDQVLSLPMYPELNDGQIKIISDRIKEKI